MTRLLRCANVHLLHWPTKKIPRIKFRYSVRFSPADYEYESHFFPSRQDFPKFYDKGLEVSKICCL